MSFPNSILSPHPRSANCYTSFERFKREHPASDKPASVSASSQSGETVGDSSDSDTPSLSARSYSNFSTQIALSNPSSPDLRSRLGSHSASGTPVIKGQGALSARVTAAKVERLFLDNGFSLGSKIDAADSVSEERVSILNKTDNAADRTCSAAEAALQGSEPQTTTEEVIDELYGKYPRLSVLERDKNSCESPGDLHIQLGVNVDEQLTAWLKPARAIDLKQAEAPLEAAAAGARPLSADVVDELYTKHPRLGVLERDMNPSESRGDLHIRPGIKVEDQLKAWLQSPSVAHVQSKGKQLSEEELDAQTMREIAIRQSMRASFIPTTREELKIKREAEGLPPLSDQQLDDIVEYFKPRQS